MGLLVPPYLNCVFKRLVPRFMVLALFLDPDRWCHAKVLTPVFIA